MDYRPEIDPAQAVDFPLERARIYHLDAGLYALKMARSRMPEPASVYMPKPQAQPQLTERPAEEPAAPEQMTASQNLDAIRAQIDRLAS